MIVQLSPQLQLRCQLHPSPGELDDWVKEGFMEKGGPKVFKSLCWPKGAAFKRGGIKCIWELKLHASNILRMYFVKKWEQPEEAWGWGGGDESGVCVKNQVDFEITWGLLQNPENRSLRSHEGMKDIL